MASRHFEFGASVERGSGILQGVTSVSIVPKYVLVSNLSFPLEIRQLLDISSLARAALSSLTAAGLNLGGCTVLGAIVASASYIAAPPAVRLTLPEANPTLSITAALAITFPFNIAFGIPIYFEMAKWVGAT